MGEDLSRIQLGLLTVAIIAAIIVGGVVLPKSSQARPTNELKNDESTTTFVEAGLPVEGGGELQQARSNASGLRVLFIGNSFIHRNDMVTTLSKLADGDDDNMPLFAVQWAPSKSTLAAAAVSPQVDELLHEVKWDYVVLQEFSKVPSFPDAQRRATMDPAVQKPHDKINAIGAQTRLFETWGYKDGNDIDAPNDTYDAMQQRLESGYNTVGAEQGIPVVAVGNTWRDVLRIDPQAPLWYSDGVHPSATGSFLAAEVFYKALTGKDPSASTYKQGGQLMPGATQTPQFWAGR